MSIVNLEMPDVSSMLSRFSARPAIEFGAALARRFSELYPPALDQPDAPKVSASRLTRIVERLCIEAQSFRQQARLGIYRRARLAHAFKWHMLEYGYNKALVDAATEALVVYLNKPQVDVPALDKARQKRARKADKAKAGQPLAVTQALDRVAEPSASDTAPAYSRAQPSPRYQALVQLYRQMHEQGERFLSIPPEQTFPGQSLAPHAGRIKRLIETTGCRRILDYGSGKGMLYKQRDITLPGITGRWPSLQSYWGVDEIQCYDPAYPPYSELPRGAFDGVISTDVLEHCPEEDIPWILDEIFSYARKFVFANVACYPAKKRLPTGENAHCTIRPKQWWTDRIREVAKKHPGIKYEVWIQSKDDTGHLIDEVICN